MWVIFKFQIETTVAAMCGVWSYLLIIVIIYSALVERKVHVFLILDLRKLNNKNVCENQF